MKLSVIIVNYNVRHFLEQAVRSCLDALKNVEGELIVVDNASTDGSKELMEDQFNDIDYVYLDSNVGFSKANNIGIERSKGEYVLLLNPDTVIAEDALQNAVDFMDRTPDAGGLGVHMVDGTGNFLPESKRGLPTPDVAFYKVFGLSSFFPKSERFGKYHLGHLDKESTHEVDVLSGAFMMMRRSTLDKSGLLDETFFMYGEDIDLSYRIIKAGYKNYYFPESRIIHYKGESTKKGSVNYVFVFYRAMIIFARKHFEKGQASLFGVFIHMAIYFRAFLAILRRLFGKTWQLILDAVLIYGSFLAATSWYAEFASKDFNLPFISNLILVYTSILCVVLLFSSVFDARFRFIRLFKGWGLASLMLLGAYALLPESVRFSRAVVLIGSGLSLLLGLSWRITLSLLFPSMFSFLRNDASRSVIVGGVNSRDATNDLLSAHDMSPEFSVGLLASENTPSPSGYVGNLGQIEQVIEDFRMNEVIFDTRHIANKEMIRTMETLKSRNVKFKMVLGSPLFCIGSQAVIRPYDGIQRGWLNRLNIQSIRRSKRLLDIIVSLFFFIALPVMLIFVDQRLAFVQNIFKVLIGQASWVGYDPRGNHPSMPSLKPGVAYNLENVILSENDGTQALEQNIKYLSPYRPWTDISILFRHVHALGRQPK